MAHFGYLSLMTTTRSVEYTTFGGCTLSTNTQCSLSLSLHLIRKLLGVLAVRPQPSNQQKSNKHKRTTQQACSQLSTTHTMRDRDDTRQNHPNAQSKQQTNSRCAPASSSTTWRGVLINSHIHNSLIGCGQTNCNVHNKKRHLIVLLLLPGRCLQAQVREGEGGRRRRRLF
jgi:hypothetical protein